jgi:hypothetical protein
MSLSYLNDPDSIYMKIFDLAHEVAADTGGTIQVIALNMTER